MTPFTALFGKLARSRPLSRPLAFVDRLLRRHGRANVLLVLAIVVPVIANAVMLVGYLNAANQRALLARQVQDTDHSADERLKALQSTATPVPGGGVTLPSSVESADMMDMLLRLAQDSAVEVVSVDEQGETTQRLGDKDYRAFKYTVQVQARVSQMVAFLNRLEQSRNSGLVVGSLSGTPSGGQNWLVKLEVVAYATGKAAAHSSSPLG